MFYFAEWVRDAFFGRGNLVCRFFQLPGVLGLNIHLMYAVHIYLKVRYSIGRSVQLEYPHAELDSGQRSGFHLT